MPPILGTLTIFCLAILCAIAAAIAATWLLRRQASDGGPIGRQMQELEDQLAEARLELKAEREGRSEAEQRLAAALEARKLLENSIIELHQGIQALEAKKAEEAAAAARQLTATRDELARIRAEAAVSEEKLRLLTEGKEEMTKEFERLANQVMAIAFQAYVDQILVPTLAPSDIVIMDMCGRPRQRKKNLW